eukprot:753421-Hanusia_phi.AAC.7
MRGGPAAILLLSLSFSIHANFGFFGHDIIEGYTSFRPSKISYSPLPTLRGGGRKKAKKKYSVSHLNWITKLSNKSIVFKNRTLTFEGGGWELIDPFEKNPRDLITPAQSLRKKRIEAAKKLMQDDADDVWESGSGEQMIIDYNDMVEAAKEVEQSVEADSLEDLKQDAWRPLKQDRKVAKAVFRPREEKPALDGLLMNYTVFPDGNSTIHEVFCFSCSRYKAQQLFVKAGRYAWDKVRPSNKELNRDIEARRAKSIMDWYGRGWDYEPIDDEMKNKMLFVKPIGTYVELDPIKKTEIADPFTGEAVEISPGVTDVDVSRFLYINSKLQLKGSANVNGAFITRAMFLCLTDVATASKFPVRPCNPNTKMCGQWILASRSRGSFDDMLQHRFRTTTDFTTVPINGGCNELVTLCSEFVCYSIRVLGGPWTFSVCGIRCGGGRCVVCEVKSTVSFHRCGIGGFGRKVASDYRCLVTARYKTAEIPKILCSEGVVLIQNSSATLTDCCVEQAGILRGCGARALDYSLLRINGSTFRSIQNCALTIGGNARVEANFSLFDLTYGALLFLLPILLMKSLPAAAFAAYPKSPYCWENMQEELQRRKEELPEDEQDMVGPREPEGGGLNRVQESFDEDVESVWGSIIKVLQCAEKEGAGRRMRRLGAGDLGRGRGGGGNGTAGAGGASQGNDSHSQGQRGLRVGVGERHATRATAGGAEPILAFQVRDGR